MKKILLILTAVLAFAYTGNVYAQKFTLSGVVLSKENNKPIDMAVVMLPQSELWAIANAKGEFTLKNIPKGETTITISCLGYVTKQFDMTIRRDSVNVKFMLDEDNLAIEGVVVTAKENLNSAATSRTVDRNTMDHMQMINVGDIASMLPGGSTINPNLLEADKSRFNIRGAGLSTGAGSFGTAVEVDGVRISNNNDFGATTGADTRNIASANVESIEVITGVPSVEYGDMMNGVVKVNTKKGRTPYILTATINPKTKQFSLDKGFDLSKKRGAINFSIERAKSIGNLSSPYNSYDRNALSLTYSNTFNQGVDRHPLRFSIGVTGNLGGQNNEADPDKFSDDYTKTRDNNIRGNLSLNWLLNKSWITSLEFKASASYTDRLTKENTNTTSASSTSVIRAKEEGYYITAPYDPTQDQDAFVIEAGNWKQLEITDSKPIDYSAHLKALWARRWGNVNNKVKLGAHFTGSGNKGRGVYYDDPKYSETNWRSYEYSSEPFMNNIAVYLEEDVNIPIGSTSLNLIAGVRSDNTSIKGSAYGTVSSFSPRFNAKYTILDSRGRNKKALRSFSVRAGWGKAVKLPSFYVLYPTPNYTDITMFNAAQSEATGLATTGYYTIPRSINYNSNLSWQYTNQAEVGTDFNLWGVNVSLSAYYNKTMNPYDRMTTYTPFAYKYYQDGTFNSNYIPSGDRIYKIDSKTGVITISDKNGVLPDYTATEITADNPNGNYRTRRTYTSETTAVNGTSYKQAGLEWVVDFGQIRALRTDVRLDGSFTYYKGVDQLLKSTYNYSRNGSDGEAYKYVGYYVGGGGMSNGSLDKQIKANITFTTHIPKIRTIITLRVESSLYKYNKSLSEWSEGQRSYKIDGSNLLNDPIKGAPLDTRGYVVTYPAYYSTIDAPDVKIPFYDAFMEAKANQDTNPALYNDLSKLISISTSDYYFVPNKISAYCALNFSVTKEIGKFASISFYANNFFNNLGKVKSSNNDSTSKLYNSTYIANFYYGATLRLKF